jgi:lipopolysaccharide/colanic/teichoic acid biosynthesis glycosyltransferase
MSAAFAIEPQVPSARVGNPTAPPSSCSLPPSIPSEEVVKNVRWLIRLDLPEPRRGLRCLSGSTRAMKRVIDVVGAIALLIVASPLMLAAAVLVKLTSRGPIIYSQERVGLNVRDRRERRRDWNPAGSTPSLPPGTVMERRVATTDRRGSTGYGRPFVLYKFRTMTADAERHGEQFAQRRDPRVTWIGRILRKTRIDELPQLWNVLKGEMSLVGPRPERPKFVAELKQEIPEFVNRLELKPGLTGLAQVVNGYDNEVEGFRRKVAYDLAYLQNCCIRNDLKILIRTVMVVLTGQGAL